MMENARELLVDNMAGEPVREPVKEPVRSERTQGCSIVTLSLDMTTFSVSIRGQMLDTHCVLHRETILCFASEFETV